MKCKPTSEAREAVGREDVSGERMAQGTQLKYVWWCFWHRWGGRLGVLPGLRTQIAALWDSQAGWTKAACRADPAGFAAHTVAR